MGVSDAFDLGSKSVDLGSDGPGVGGVKYLVTKSSIDSALVRSTSGKPVSGLY